MMRAATVYKAAIQLALDGSCTKLREELKKTGIKFFVTHDSKGVIEVYSDPSIKAYIPKVYNGWPVQFFIWLGKDITIDLDKEIQ